MVAGAGTAAMGPGWGDAMCSRQSKGELGEERGGRKGCVRSGGQRDPEAAAGER